MLISIDTETTGVERFHSATIYFVTVCKDNNEQLNWHWPVDPLTRKVRIPKGDVAEIQAEIDAATVIVGQNVKFDVGMFERIGITDWPWHKTEDTLSAGHVLASNQPHNLTDMAAHYLGYDIFPLEQKVKQATQEARRVVQQARLRVKRGKDDNPLARWRIAEAGLEEMPAAKEECWKYDMWLPGQLAAYDPQLGASHPEWTTALSKYANGDSSVTLRLWQVMHRELKRRGYLKVYDCMKRRSQLAADMERRGITFSQVRLEELRSKFTQKSETLGKRCVTIAASYPKLEEATEVTDGEGFELTLPKAGINKSLRTFCFDVLGLEPIRGHKSKTAAPTLDKAAMAYYEETLAAGSRPHTFVKSLRTKRKLDTQLTYMAGYERFALPLHLRGCISPQKHEWYLLHPSLNPTGSDTLRWTSSNPNEQNIAKQREECLRCYGKGKLADGETCSSCEGKGYTSESLRYLFGPPPGWEWWSLDAKNIELRIPFYKAGEQELIDLFEQPDKAPYYGSNHLLNFATVYPELWAKELAEVGIEKVGPHCKKKYAATWYQWCKNGGFAIQYGAQDRADGHGTADRAFHRPGAHALLKNRFRKLEELNAKCMRQAEKWGYVETEPDITVDPDHGYPLLCTRNEWGRVKPTVPLSYYVQGTAMWWTAKGMFRTEDKLAEWRRTGFNAWIALQVHDEIVFCLPKAADPREDPKRSNLGRIRILQGLMEQGGKDIGVPTPVGVEYHPVHWGEGVTL